MVIPSQKHNHLDKIKLFTVMKISTCHVYYIEGENPYTQISINGFALDGFGDVVCTNIEDSAEYGDDKKVKELVSLYTLGSLHWIESNAFSFNEDDLYLYNPTKTLPVAAEDIAEIESLFLLESAANNEPKKEPDDSKGGGNEYG